MPSTVIGIFDRNDDAQNAVEQLVKKGFDRTNIDISAGGSTATTTTNDDGSYGNTQEKESGIAHFFKNLFGNDDDEANRYSTVGSKSEAIVTVHAQSTEEAERAADLLDDYGAVNVDDKANEYGYSSGGSSFGNMDAGADYTMNPAVSGTATAIGNATDYNDTNTDTRTDVGANTNTGIETSAGISSNTNNTGITANTDTDTNTGSTIPVVQENIEVGKRTVETGGIRVRSRIVERPVEQSVRLREEHVRVERTPVDRVVTGADLATFQDKNIELTETAEVPVVSKEARVVEEIKLTKDATEREETIHDTVRNTEVNVENIEGTNTANKYKDTDATSSSAL